MKNMIKQSVVWCGLGFSSATFALTVSFTEIGEFVPSMRSPKPAVVANDGTVGFMTGTQLLSWKALDGARVIAEDDAPIRWVSISADGDSILFSTPSKGGPNPSHATDYLYKNGEVKSYRYDVLDWEYPPGALVGTPKLFSLSGNGDVMGGVIQYPGYYTNYGVEGDRPALLNHSELQVMDEGPEGMVLGISFNGDKFVTAPHYAGFAGAASAQFATVWGADGNFVTSQREMYVRDMSADGSIVLGETKRPDCTFLCAYDTITVLWNAATNSYTEIADLEHPEAMTSDASIVVGNGQSNEIKIWDATNGTRDLVSVLLSHGVDLSGWSGLRVEDMSEDGSRILVYGVNPDGESRLGLINLVPECRATL